MWCCLMQTHKLILYISHGPENAGGNCELATHNLFCRHPNWIIGQIDRARQAGFLAYLPSPITEEYWFYMAHYYCIISPQEWDFLRRKRSRTLLLCSRKQVLQLRSSYGPSPFFLFSYGYHWFSKIQAGVAATGVGGHRQGGASYEEWTEVVLIDVPPCERRCLSLWEPAMYTTSH